MCCVGPWKGFNCLVFLIKAAEAAAVKSFLLFLASSIMEKAAAPTVDEAPDKAPVKSPRVRIETLTPTDAVFVVEGITTAMANALRRVCIAEVPTLAVNEMLVLENSTSVHDELVGHRVSLVPLRHLADPRLQTMRRRGHCDCGDVCPRCELEMTVDMENDTDGCVTVTSRDFCSELVAPVNAGTAGHRLMCCGPHEHFHAVCKVCVGTGKAHPKWSPVALCTFTAIANDQGVVSTGSIQPYGAFRFRIESHGQLQSTELLAAAFDVLERKCAAFCTNNDAEI
jgi:hypothetical protein